MANRRKRFNLNTKKKLLVDSFKACQRTEPITKKPERKKEICGCGKGFVQINWGGIKLCSECFRRQQVSQRWDRKEKEIREAVKKEAIDLAGDPVILVLGYQGKPEDEKYFISVYGCGKNPKHKCYKNYREHNLDLASAEIAFEWLKSRIPHGSV